jgi:WD40 repeat protein
MANGSSDRTVKYWDLETMESISQSATDASTITHLTFSGECPDHLFACSSENIRLWNIETNQQLDCLGVPPKPVGDMKIAPSSRFLFLTTI